TPATAEIWAIYIEPGHWGKGFGRALCDVAEQELRRQGFRAVTLWVSPRTRARCGSINRMALFTMTPTPRVSQRGGKQLREVRLRKQSGELDIAPAGSDFPA